MKYLISGMQQLIKERKFAVYVCEPYTFLVGCIKERVYLVDTHPVSAMFGGTNTALLVSSDPSNEGSLSICKWLWKRLYESNIKEENTQSLSVLSVHWLKN